MRLAHWLLTALSLLLVLAVVAWEMQERTGPGPLHPAHAAVSGHVPGALARTGGAHPVSIGACGLRGCCPCRQTDHGRATDGSGARERGDT